MPSTNGGTVPLTPPPSPWIRTTVVIAALVISMAIGSMIVSTSEVDFFRQRRSDMVIAADTAGLRANERRTQRKTQSMTSSIQGSGEASRESAALASPDPVAEHVKVPLGRGKRFPTVTDNFAAPVCVTVPDTGNYIGNRSAGIGTSAERAAGDSFFRNTDLRSNVHFSVDGPVSAYPAAAQQSQEGHGGTGLGLDEPRFPAVGRVWGNEACAEEEGLFIKDGIFEAGARFVPQWEVELGATEEDVCGPGGIAVHVLRASGVHPKGIFSSAGGAGAKVSSASGAVYPADIEMGFPAHRWNVFRFGTVPPLRPEIFPELLDTDIRKAVGFTLCLPPPSVKDSSLRPQALTRVVNLYRGPIYGSLFWGRYPKDSAKPNSCPKSRMLDCLATEDVSQMKTADMVTFYGGEGGRLEERGYPGQIWNVHLWESASGRPIMTDGHYTSKFNITTTMTGRSSFPQYWHIMGSNIADRSAWKNMKPLPPFSLENRTGMVLAMYSTCSSWSDRTRRLQDLIRDFPPDAVHSYGKCAHNKDFPKEIPEHQVYGDKNGERYRDFKAIIQRKYKFEIVIQNSICYDFVDEKIFEALLRGTVPIYIGAPNILDFLPKGYKMIIRWEDFNTNKELVDYVLDLDRNPEKLAEYHTWRKADHVEFPRFIQRVYPRFHASSTKSESWECFTCSQVIMSRLFDMTLPNAPPNHSCCDQGSQKGCAKIWQDFRNQGAKRLAYAPYKKSN